MDSVAWILTSLVLIVLIYFASRSYVFKLRQRFFVRLMEIIEPLWQRKIKGIKQKLFAKHFADVVSADPILKSKNSFRILELGCGTGVNLGFYPPGSHVILEDLNAEFADKLRARVLKQHPELILERLVHQPAEDMSTIPSCSVDVVVTTSLLCSVTDGQKALEEIKRVLVPGGKYIFIEHIIDKQNIWRRYTQLFSTHSGIWTFFGCGCHLTRRSDLLIHKAGFSTVTMDRFTAQHFDLRDLFMTYIIFCTAVHIQGAAVK